MHAHNFWTGFFLSHFKMIFYTLSMVLFVVPMSHAADNQTFFPSINLLLTGHETCNMLCDDANDLKYDISYNGLYYYQPDMSYTNYGLKQLSDKDFKRLSTMDRRKVADKLLTSLFFGYTANTLKEKISSGSFLCSVRQGLSRQKNNMAAVEEEIRNEDRYYHSTYAVNEIYDIMARFYAMDHLDKHYLNNWMAYILTQTIMFSPAYELDSAHYPNVASVYNWLVMDMNEDIGMRYSTYMHMASSDNWRRFRSPEDNGREMLEIYTLDLNDANVPKAAKALQNWYLDDDYDTLVIGLNQNTIPQSLFNTSVTTGFDFYRELVKSGGFVRGSVRRLVDFFFTDHDEVKKTQITKFIVASQPETWQDVLLQIVFSEEFLLHTTRAKSAEELFYSLVKKLDYKHYKYTFHYFVEYLEDMNQASMKYKLGKLERTPLDSLSFAYYHKYIREQIMDENVCGAIEEGEYQNWNNDGWRPGLLGDDRFTYTMDDPKATVRSFVTYLFEFMIHRAPTSSELTMFTDNMLRDSGDYEWSYNFSVVDGGCYDRRENAAEDILDYISRLSELYMFQEVQ